MGSSVAGERLEPFLVSGVATVYAGCLGTVLFRRLAAAHGVICVACTLPLFAPAGPKGPSAWVVEPSGVVGIALLPPAQVALVYQERREAQADARTADAPDGR